MTHSKHEVPLILVGPQIGREHQAICRAPTKFLYNLEVIMHWEMEHEMTTDYEVTREDVRELQGAAGSKEIQKNFLM